MTLEAVVAAEPDVRDNYVYYKLDAKTLTLEGKADEASDDETSDDKYPINIDSKSSFGHGKALGHSK